MTQPDAEASRGSMDCTQNVCCFHCSCVILGQEQKWPLSSKIASLMTVAEALQKSFPDTSCPDPDKNVICNRCHKAVENVLRKKESADQMQKESLQAELELKLLLPGIHLTDTHNEETSPDPSLSWFAVLASSNTEELTIHGSTQGREFVKKNWEVFSKYPSFCFPFEEDKQAGGSFYDHKHTTNPDNSENAGLHEKNGMKENLSSTISDISSNQSEGGDSLPSAPTTEDGPTNRSRRRVASVKCELQTSKSKKAKLQPNSDGKKINTNVSSTISVSKQKQPFLKKVVSSPRISLRKKSMGPDRSRSYASLAGLKEKSQRKYRPPKIHCSEAEQNFVLSHTEVYPLDHPKNKDVSETKLRFQRIDPEKLDLPFDKTRPWACLRCGHTTTSRKRALLHFRTYHDLRDLWSRFHVCQLSPEKGAETILDQYRLDRPYLCVLCGRDYLNQRAELHISKDHPGISPEQLELVIVKKESGPKLIVLYLYGRSSIYYLLDKEGHLQEMKMVDTSELKHKVLFSFKEFSSQEKYESDEEYKYRVEVTQLGTDDDTEISSISNGNSTNNDLSSVSTKLLEEDGEEIKQIFRRKKKKKDNSFDEINQPQYSCSVCYAATNSKKIQSMHDTMHQKEIGKWECQLCGERFRKANLILTHISVFHNLVAQDCLAHMKAIGLESFSLSDSISENQDQDITNVESNQQNGVVSFTGEQENDSFQQQTSNAPSEPTNEEINVWKKQLMTIEHCDICWKTVKTQAGMMKHLRNAHKIRNYRCPVCKLSFISHNFLLFHLEEMHKSFIAKKKYFLCSACQRVITGRASFVAHCVNHMKENFKCNICNTTLNSPDKLSIHMKNHDPVKALLDTPFMCPLCNKIIKERKKVEMHLMTHCPSMVDPYRCTQCQKTCVTEQGLRAHVETHKATRGMVCHVCGKVFTRPIRFREHLQMHENPDPFKCKLCHKKVSSTEGLKRHMDLVHSENRTKDVVCHLCGKALASNYSLKLHLKLVHSPNKVKRSPKNKRCQYCDKVYSKPYQLTRHIEVHHIGNNYYLCKYCGDSFSSRSLYRRHLDVHPEFKPWRCEICGEKYVFQKTWLDHMTKEHPGHDDTQQEERFACKICGNTYRKLWTLRNHLDVEHNDERELANFEKIRFFCRFCNRGFLYKSGMETHIHKVHRDKLKEEDDADPKMDNDVAAVVVAQKEAVTEDIPQGNRNEICIETGSSTITLEQEAAVHLLSQLQFQVEHNQFGL